MFAPDSGSEASASHLRYGAADGVPVLIDYERSIIEERPLIERKGASDVVRPRYSGVQGRIKALLSPPKERTRRNIQQLINLLEKRDQPKVLVIGGGTIGQGMDALYDHPTIGLIAFDIYKSEFSHFVADAHAIPLADGSVDAVVCQAVLEHVLEPAQVADEIWRVLKSDGVVYAETPFMQQVHEGAYDFTRFTESGHRYLFRRFELIDSGVTAGPGTQLLWSIDYFVRSLFRSRAAGKVAKLMFFWLHAFDRLVPESFASDAASGVFFLGRKANRAVRPKEMVRFYRGAQR